MELVIHSLAAVARGALRVYASDVAYRVAVQMAVSLLVLLVLLSAGAHGRPPASPLPPDDLDACWVDEQPCP